MKSKTTRIKDSATKPVGIDDIAGYAKTRSPDHAAICGALRKEIDSCLPTATSKIWHGSPVWFIGENPVVGYNVTSKNEVCLLFWNGQSFDEQVFKPVGKGGKAAQISFANVFEIDTKILRRWLKKAGTMIWDYRKMYKERLAATKAAKPNAKRPAKRA
jgi:hypothetical protein